MGHRHWFVILTTDEGEYRSGPYPSRRSAERKARERHKHASAGAVKVIYDPRPSAPRGHPSPAPRAASDDCRRVSPQPIAPDVM